MQSADHPKIQSPPAGQWEAQHHDPAMSGTGQLWLGNNHPGHTLPSSNPMQPWSEPFPSAGDDVHRRGERQFLILGDNTGDSYSLAWADDTFCWLDPQDLQPPNTVTPTLHAWMSSVNGRNGERVPIGRYYQPVTLSATSPSIIRKPSIYSVSRLSRPPDFYREIFKHIWFRPDSISISNKTDTMWQKQIWNGE